MSTTLQSITQSLLRVAGSAGLVAQQQPGVSSHTPDPDFISNLRPSHSCKVGDAPLKAAQCRFVGGRCAAESGAVSDQSQSEP